MWLTSHSWEGLLKAESALWPCWAKLTKRSSSFMNAGTDVGPAREEPAGGCLFGLSYSDYLSSKIRYCAAICWACTGNLAGIMHIADSMLHPTYPGVKIWWPNFRAWHSVNIKNRWLAALYLLLGGVYDHIEECISGNFLDGSGAGLAFRRWQAWHHGRRYLK